MNEGVGSTTIIVIIMVFITVVSAYLAYNVNYTKAFRMKNKIIAMYEKADGHCDPGTECRTTIAQYAEEIGYAGDTLNCDNNPYKPTGSSLISKERVESSYQGKKVSYCVYKMKGDTTGTSGDDLIDPNKPQYYFRVVTSIDIQIPIVQNVFNLRWLNVTGDTKLFEMTN
jgi:hypothetical protein